MVTPVCIDIIIQMWQCASRMGAMETDMVAVLGQHIKAEFLAIMAKQ